VGDQFRIQFWHDVWIGDRTLMEAFLVLFSIACSKEALVAIHMWFSNDTCQWNVTFIKAVHDWEMELVTSFFDLLYSIRLRR
jgi:hypothetical protein